MSEHIYDIKDIYLYPSIYQKGPWTNIDLFRLPSPVPRSQVRDINSDITKSYLHPHYILKQKI